MSQTGIGKLLIIILRWNCRGKKSPPGDRHTGFNKSFGHFKALFVTGVKSGIGYKNILGTGSLQFAGFLSDFAWWKKTHSAPFNMGISAVAAVKRAPPFCLQVEHAAV